MALSIFWEARLAWAVINMNPFYLLVLITLVPLLGLAGAVLVHLVKRAIDARTEARTASPKKPLYPWRHPWHSRDNMERTTRPVANPYKTAFPYRVVGLSPVAFVDPNATKEVHTDDRPSGLE
jgi:hypothetical protein